MARIKVSDLRRIQDIIFKEEISYSRGVEMLNEIACNYSALPMYDTMPQIREFYDIAKSSKTYDDFMVALGRYNKR